MTTATLRVVTTNHEFIDKVNFIHDDNTDATKVTITDTVVTDVQAAFDELVTNTTIVDLRIFNSGAAPAANYIHAGGTITSAELDSKQKKSGISQVNTFTLTFNLQG